MTKHTTIVVHGSLRVKREKKRKKILLVVGFIEGVFNEVVKAVVIHPLVEISEDAFSEVLPLTAADGVVTLAAEGLVANIAESVFREIWPVTACHGFTETPEKKIKRSTLLQRQYLFPKILPFK